MTSTPIRGSIRALIDWQIAEGTDCISVTGTTGEAPTLNVDEHCEIIQIAVEQVAGRVPVLAGCGANSTAEAIALARFAHKVGASHQLQVVPYYNKPGQEGIYRHFRAIAEAVGELPMVLYNVPGRTIADMQHETVLRLSEIPGIIGIKDATGDLARGQWLLRDTPERFSVYSGDDATAVALMLCGGHGNISVTANIAPRLMHELCAAAMAGDAPKAMSIQNLLLPLHRGLFIEANPIPIKWAMQRLGLCSGTLRLPMIELDAANQPKIEAALKTAVSVRRMRGPRRRAVKSIATNNCRSRGDQPPSGPMASAIVALGKIAVFTTARVSTVSGSSRQRTQVSGNSAAHCANTCGGQMAGIRARPLCSQADIMI